MNAYEALDYAYKLRDHLYTLEILDDIEPKLKSDLDSLSAIEDRIFHLNQQLDELKRLGVILDKEYQLYNFRYGLGESQSDFEYSKSMRKDTWAKIYKVGEDREKLMNELRSQRNLRDKLSSEVGQVQKKFTSTRNFFNLKTNFVALYSIVTVNLSGDRMVFALLTESQRDRVTIDTLDIYSINSPLGRACLGKRSGEKFSFIAPSGRTLEGNVISCDFPTAVQMDNLIKIMEARPLSQRPAQTNQFALFDRYGSNNSRHRKGG